MSYSPVQTNYQQLNSTKTGLILSFSIRYIQIQIWAGPILNTKSLRWSRLLEFLELLIQKLMTRPLIGANKILLCGFGRLPLTVSQGSLQSRKKSVILNYLGFDPPTPPHECDNSHNNNNDNNFSLHFWTNWATFFLLWHLPLHTFFRSESRWFSQWVKVGVGDGSV